MFEDNGLVHGAHISVKVNDDMETEIFDGTIYAIEVGGGKQSSPRIRIVALDALEQWKLAPRTRIYNDSTVEDIVSSLADEHGLSADITILGDFKAETTTQLNQNDFDFLMQLAYKVGADVWLKENRLTVRAANAIPDGDTNLSWNDFDHIRVNANARNQPYRVTASGWDYHDGEAVHAGSVTHVDSGPDNHDNVIGAVGQGEIYPDIIAGTTVEAGVIAQAVYDRRHRKFFGMEGKTGYRPGLQIGKAIRISHIAERFSGKYYVIQTRHTFTVEEGFRSFIVADGVSLGESYQHKGNSDEHRNRRTGNGRKTKSGRGSLVLRVIHWLYRHLLKQ